MQRVLIGGVAAFFMVLAGLLFWQTAANQESVIPAPPTAPEAPKASREELRFNRYDRNRDELVSRLEMMGSRTKAFKALDTDGNNLLTFEEWAAATAQRFAGADRNKDQLLTRKEFAQTRPKLVAKPGCRC